MNSKSLFSAAGLLIIAVLLVVSVALISALPSLRIDLTEDELYSLSDGTRNIVSTLDKPIDLMFFYSESATEDVPQIRSYANRVQELLREIVIASNGRLNLEVIDPEPFSEEEDLATQFGIRAVPVSQGGEEVYFGLVVADANDEIPLEARSTETLGLIRPDQEEFLEYEFMKLITRVENPDRQVIGLITELDIDGGFNPAVGQATPPWMIMDVIRQLYEVRRVDLTADSIDEDIDILMLVHPGQLSEQMLYAIDQHVLRHGKAILFLDPNADSMVSRFSDGNMVPAGMSSELPGLLASWGIDFDNSKVLTDNKFALRVVMGQGQRPIAHLGMLGVPREGLTSDDIITSRLESINLSSSGAISAVEGATTRFEPLIHSSTDAMLMDGALLENVTDPSILFDEFESANQQFTIAARVSGVVESAFPDGRPALPVEESEAAEDNDAQTSDADAADQDEVAQDDAADTEDEPEPDSAAIGNANDDDSDASQTESETAVEHMSGSNGEINLLVFADTDLLTDRLWVQVAQFMGQRVPQPFANNGDVVVNSLDNLSGGADLVSIRSRGRYARPFMRVVELQREADDRLRTEEAELLDRLAATQDKLNELTQADDGQVIGQLSPEVQAEINQFNDELLVTRRSLRDVQHQLNQEIEQLGTNLKWINTALIPLLLTIIVLVVSFMRARRRRTAS